MYKEYKNVILLSSAIDDPSDDSDILTWYTKVFCRSFCSTVEENLKYMKGVIIRFDQLLAQMASPDDDHRYVAMLYASVNQVFKSVDDNVDLMLTAIITDGFSEDIIAFEIPPIPMGKAITEYREVNLQLIAPIQEFLTKIGECVIKLINAN